MAYYKDLTTLPKGVKNNLPLHARVIYMNAFNHAWDEYRDEDKRTFVSPREETAARVAWSAVKRQYEKDEGSGEWKRKASEEKVRSWAEGK
jgi:cation transport regulator